MTQLKVLIPLDGSKLAEAPLSYLSALRGLGDVHVTLVSVVDEHEEARSLSGQEAVLREQNVLASYLREVASEVQRHLGIHVDTRVASGQPANSILGLARELGSDLLVISTHGRTGASRWRLGSVADKVVRGAPCNLIVMGPRAAQTAEWFAEFVEPFQAVIVPLDGSSLSEQAIPVAQQFTDSYGSVLHFVRVVTVPVYGDISGDMGYPDLLDVMEDNARTYLESIAQRTGTESSAVRKVIVGSPAAALLDYVDENRADLIVMTSHGRSGFSRTALGSVTDRLLGSNAPVLVVHPAEAGNES